MVFNKIQQYQKPYINSYLRKNN